MCSPFVIIISYMIANMKGLYIHQSQLGLIYASGMKPLKAQVQKRISQSLWCILDINLPLNISVVVQVVILKVEEDDTGEAHSAADEVWHWLKLW